jgi:hypothetical protein
VTFDPTNQLGQRPITFIREKLHDRAHMGEQVLGLFPVTPATPCPRRVRSLRPSCTARPGLVASSIAPPFPGRLAGLVMHRGMQERPASDRLHFFLKRDIRSLSISFL